MVQYQITALTGQSQIGSTNYTQRILRVVFTGIVNIYRLDKGRLKEVMPFHIYSHSFFDPFYKSNSHNKINRVRHCRNCISKYTSLSPSHFNFPTQVSAVSRKPAWLA
jgi:hypothetical protein